MLLYEMFAIGIALVLVVAAIGGLARVMRGPEETALLRLARAAPAQRRLLASAAQQERDARAAASQRRLVAAAAAGAGRASRSIAAPPRGRSSPTGLDSTLPQAPIRRCTRGAALTASRHTHHSTRNTRRERLKSGSRIILRQGARVMKDTSLPREVSSALPREASSACGISHFLRFRRQAEGR